MATVQDPPRPTQPSKHDAFIEAQLSRAMGRVRAIDVTLALLGFAVLTLAFAVGMVVLDRCFDLTSFTRLTAFLGFVLVAAAYLSVTLVWPLRRHVNLYYAARAIERTVPGAKNSLVNWLDLRHENLPPAIRNAVVQRAARDLRQADLEQVISGRRAGWLGGAAFGLFLVALLLLVLLGPGPFVRAVAPFVEVPRTTRTTLTLVQPTGDVTVSAGQPVTFAVDVGGKVPQPGRTDSVRLLFRHRQTDLYEEQPLELRADRRWDTVLPAARVRNGLWYRVAGGDAQTPEYRVTVVPWPLVTGMDVTYHHPPYLGWADESFPGHSGNLKAIRGTRVTLLAHTNRPVRSGRLEVEYADGRETVRAGLVPDDPEALRFQFAIKKDGRYRIWFTATDGQDNPDAPALTIQALPDNPPQVTLTKPAEWVKLPANGTLQVEGSATDDFGVKHMRLRLQVKDGPMLEAKRYRPDKDFRLADGAYPRKLEYSDFAALDQVKDERGKPFALVPGTVLEYWLEALDAGEGPNVGASKHQFVEVLEPEADPKKKEQDQKQAEQKQKEHEAEQDRKLDEENKALQQPKGPPRADEKKPDPEQEKKDQQTQDQARQVQEELNKQQQEKDRKKGDGKGDGQQGPKGKEKDGGESGPKPGKDKDPGKGDGKDQAGDQKGGGQQGGKPNASEGKDQGQGDAQPKTQPKDQPGDRQGAGANRDAGQPEPKTEKGQDKSDQRGEPRPEHAQGKAGGNGPMAEKTDAKSSGQEGPGADKASPGESRGEGQAPGKTAKKDGGPDSAQAKAGGNGPAGEEKAGGGANNSVARGDKKDDQPKPSEAAMKEIADLLKQLRGDDATKREDAARRLKELADAAKDAATRQAARDALEQTKEGPVGKTPGTGTARKPPENSDDTNVGEPKGKAPGQSPMAGASKDGGQQGGNAEAKDGGGMGDGGNANQRGPAGAKPGGGDPNAGPAGSGGGNGNDPPGGAADPRHQGKAGDLQLQNLKEQLNRMTPEERQRLFKKLNLDAEQFQRDLKELVEKDAEPEGQLPDPKRAGSLPNIGARPATGGSGKPGEVKAGGPALPPPEFRDAYREFTRRVSEGQKPPEKK